MATLLGVRIQNYKSLRDVTLGKLRDNSQPPLTPLTAVIGKNGVGKSSLFDAFGFLSDCLRANVEEACNLRGRGGFNGLRSQGTSGPIEFEIHFLEENQHIPLTYALAININKKGSPYISGELLSASAGVIDVPSALIDSGKLMVSVLGYMEKYPRISAFRQFMESWYFSYFTPDAARSLPVYGAQSQLNVHGDNLANVVQFMEREHRDRFDDILQRIASRIPGIHKIDSQKTPDGRLLLRFNDRGFHDPFYSHQMSDGTLKMFAYLLLLESPSPPSLICIEEPENGLYHKLLEALANEFRQFAQKEGSRSQLFVTTHQPYFVNALEPQEVWILEKGQDGFSTIRRASDDPLVVNLVEEGLPLGSLWYSDYLDAR